MSTSTTIQRAVQLYLDERRQLGFELRVAGRQLMRFARYADARAHQGPLTLDLQLAWACEHVNRTGPVAARRDIANLHLIEQTLTVPMKRFDRPMVGFLSREQMLAVLDIPTTNWLGQRDRLLLTLLYNTGARVSEIVGIRVEDVALSETPSVLLRGKGRKQRSVPLWKTTARDVRAWLRLNDQLTASSPLLPTREGHVMTRANVTQRLRLATRAATDRHPELAKQSVSPHVIRHTTAMHLLQAGVDISVIALWLGHESPSTTHMYVEADLGMKERALERLKPPEVKPARYRPPDALLRFLQGL